MTDPVVTEALAFEHGLTPEEYQRIVEILLRVPSYTELGIFSVMWSEHCSYKSSRSHLKRLPTASKRLLAGPGENAGALDIGRGLAAVFKIESHNHPSFVEPFQGAATGVGGILRDIFTMGARPIASLDSLRFGKPETETTRRLLRGVVAGIAAYGNCMGVPTVGGEVDFDPSYDGNILVNVFNLGIAKKDRLFSAAAKGVGNPVIYVGSRTGKDGIHGASLLASSEFDDTTEEKRQTVQVGDPFAEKSLLEACLEAMETGAIIAIQDMGAAGLTCSTTEMASAGGVGMEVDLDLVPRRDSEMSSYEIMLSESQERMLLVAKEGREEEILDVFLKWDLEAVVIGRVTEGDRVRVSYQGKVVADVPAGPVAANPPKAERPLLLPNPPKGAYDPADLDEPGDYHRLLLDLASHPALAHKGWIMTQYDHMVGTNTVIRPGGDGALCRLKEEGQGPQRGLALAVDGNQSYARLDPYAGGALAVCESARNVAVTGARPIGITDCLNFGNPEKPKVMGQFSRAVDGIRDAALALGIPVTGGNVSFYNETDGEGVAPTPVCATVGLCEDLDLRCEPFFPEGGLAVWHLGNSRIELGGSAYERFILKRSPAEAALPPTVDLEAERGLIDLLLSGISKGLFLSAHDISKGGLLMALVACSVGRDPAIGFSVDTAKVASDVAPHLLLLSEAQGRAIVTTKDDADVATVAAQSSVPAIRIGTTGGPAFHVDHGKRPGIIDLPAARVAALYRRRFASWIGS